MTEMEREAILAERAEKRQIMFERMEVKRKLKMGIRGRLTSRNFYKHSCEKVKNRKRNEKPNH
jgi:RNA polymerase-associated protein RTF1